MRCSSAAAINITSLADNGTCDRPDSAARRRPRIKQIVVLDAPTDRSAVTISPDKAFTLPEK